MINGIVNVNKPAGFTSFDVIGKLRGITHQKKIGHTGTLDPEAVGVLPVCFGNATRVCELLMDHEKTYECILQLGITTDTQDTSRSCRADFHRVNIALKDLKEAVEAASAEFIGEYEQLPPMFSAKRVNGKHLYELARKGQEIERKKCLVKIFSIDVLSCGSAAGNISTVSEDGADISYIGDGFIYPDEEAEVLYARLRITCSKGTYIRTLCHDIGERLGCGGAMAALKRIAVGPFVMDNSVTLQELEQLMREEGNIDKALLSVDSLFMNYRAVRVKEANMKALLNGNMLKRGFVEELSDGGCVQENSVLSCDNEESFRVYDADSCFKAIYKWNGNEEGFTPVKMFL